MTLTPRLRKLALTAHVTASAVWLGAVVVSLVLAVAGLVIGDTRVVRSVHLTVDVIAWFILVPVSIASLLTGVLQSLATRWGLFRHYWVLVKLLVNVLATAVLLVHTRSLDRTALIAAKETLSDADLLELRSPALLVHAAAALTALLAAVALSVFKPPGMTRYGARKQES